MFVSVEEEKADGVAKTSDPDKFAQLATKSSDSLLGDYFKYYLTETE